MPRKITQKMGDRSDELEAKVAALEDSIEARFEAFEAKNDAKFESLRQSLLQDLTKVMSLHPNT